MRRILGATRTLHVLKSGELLGPDKVDKPVFGCEGGYGQLSTSYDACSNNEPIFMARDMSPAIFSLPLIKAIWPLSVPAIMSR